MISQTIIKHSLNCAIKAGELDAETNTNECYSTFLTKSVIYLYNTIALENNYTYLCLQPEDIKEISNNALKAEEIGGILSTYEIVQAIGEYKNSYGKIIDKRTKSYRKLKAIAEVCNYYKNIGFYSTINGNYEDLDLNKIKECLKLD